MARDCPISTDAPLLDSESESVEQSMRNVTITELNRQSLELFSDLGKIAVQLEPVTPLVDINWRESFASAKAPNQDPASCWQTISSSLSVTSSIIRRAGEKPNIKEMEMLTESIADASRKEFWRLPFGKYGIIEIYLDLLADEKNLGFGWAKSALRLLNNCCVDPENFGAADCNRELITPRIKTAKVVPLIAQEQHHRPCLSLLSQLGLENDNFQEQLAREGIVERIIEMLQLEWFSDEQALDQILEVLRWPVCESNLLQDCSNALRSLSTVFHMANVSTENLASLTFLVSLLLDKGELPAAENFLIEVLLFLLSSDPLATKYRTAIEESGLILSSYPRNEEDGDDTEDDLELLITARKGLINALGQTATRSQFIEQCTLESDVTQTLLRFLSLPIPQVQICSLIMIGNTIIGSRQRALDLIEHSELLPKLVNNFDTTSNGLVLQSSFEVMTLLSRRIEDRSGMGRLGVLESMARSWLQDVDVQLRSTALRSTQQILQGSFDNICRFLVARTVGGKPLIHHLLQVFQQSTDSSIRSSCGVVILEIWHSTFTLTRILSNEKESENTNSALESLNMHSLSNAEDRQAKMSDSFLLHGFSLDLLRSAIFELYRTHQDIIEALLAAISPEIPHLATRVWLTLALMAKQEEGAGIIYDTLVDGSGVEALAAVLSDKGEQNSKNLSNARVLLNELMTRYASNHDRIKAMTPLWHLSVQSSPSSDVP